MKTLLLMTALCSLFADGDRERGLQLYQAGKYKEAQAAFTAALRGDPDSAELQWNLALSAWRAGDLPTAEVAAEKYAALADVANDELHRGLLGAVRFDEALGIEEQADQAIASAQSQQDPNAEQPVDPLPLLEGALEKAKHAKNHFVRGAQANPTPELLRNTERALRKIEELEKRIEELKKQREQQQQDGDQQEDDKQPQPDGQEDDKEKSDKDEGDQKKGDEKSEQDPGEQKQDEKQEGEESQQEQESEQQNGEPDPAQQQEGEGESPPEQSEPQPDAGEQPGSEQQSDEGQPPPPPEPEPQDSRADAPGEGAQALELTPEQAQRLLERAKRLDEQLKQARARRQNQRRAVERDW